MAMTFVLILGISMLVILAAMLAAEIGGNEK